MPWDTISDHPEIKIRLSQYQEHILDTEALNNKPESKVILHHGTFLINACLITSVDRSRLCGRCCLLMCILSYKLVITWHIMKMIGVKLTGFSNWLSQQGWKLHTNGDWISSQSKKNTNMRTWFVAAWYLGWFSNLNLLIFIRFGCLEPLYIC